MDVAAPSSVESSSATATFNDHPLVKFEYGADVHLHHVPSGVTLHLHSCFLTEHALSESRLNDVLGSCQHLSLAQIIDFFELIECVPGVRCARRPLVVANDKLVNAILVAVTLGLERKAHELVAVFSLETRQQASVSYETIVSLVKHRAHYPLDMMRGLLSLLVQLPKVGFGKFLSMDDAVDDLVDLASDPSYGPKFYGKLLMDLTVAELSKALRATFADFLPSPTEEAKAGARNRLCRTCEGKLIQVVGLGTGAPRPAMIYGSPRELFGAKDDMRGALSATPFPPVDAEDAFFASANFTLRIEESGAPVGVPTVPSCSLLVHDWVMYRRWPYFRRVIDSGMSESVTRVLTLPRDFPPTLLASLVSFIYTGENCAESVFSSELFNHQSFADTCGDLFGFGGEGLEQFKPYAIDYLTEFAGDYDLDDTERAVYSNVTLTGVTTVTGASTVASSSACRAPPPRHVATWRILG